MASVTGNSSYFERDYTVLDLNSSIRQRLMRSQFWRKPRSTDSSPQLFHTSSDRQYSWIGVYIDIRLGWLKNCCRITIDNAVSYVNVGRRSSLWPKNHLLWWVPFLIQILCKQPILPLFSGNNPQMSDQATLHPQRLIAYHSLWHSGIIFRNDLGGAAINRLSVTRARQHWYIWVVVSTTRRHIPYKRCIARFCKGKIWRLGHPMECSLVPRCDHATCYALFFFCTSLFVVRERRCCNG